MPTEIKEKYPHLEISILSSDAIHEDNIAKRIDSEYFQNEHLNIIETIKKQNHIQLKDTDILIIHPTEIKREYVDQNEENSVWFFRTQNLRPLFVDTELNRVHISQEDASKLKKNSILYGDILITRTGANCGDCALYDIEEQAIASSHVLIVRNSFFIQSFLAVFLNTSFGKIQINRGIYGGLQPEIAPYYLKNIYIPTLSISFQQEIDKIVKDSEDVLKQSRLLYKEAQDILYVELGLNPDNPLGEFEEEGLSISVQTLQESYAQTGRLDAEYYQKRYNRLENKIKRYKEGSDSVSNLVNIKDINFVPLEKQAYRYIELADIGNQGNIVSYTKGLGETLPTRARRIVSSGDVIISSIEGSLNSCALITHDFDQCIVSNGFFVFSSPTINSETLLVLFKSAIYQDYLKRFTSGTILCAINKNELDNIFLPKINDKIQKKIADKIQQSFILQTQAKNLLKDAIAQVETKISNQV